MKWGDWGEWYFKGYFHSYIISHVEDVIRSESLECTY